MGNEYLCMLIMGCALRFVNGRLIQAKQEKSRRRCSVSGFGQSCGRGERIRTYGLFVPNVALYQAKLHPAVKRGEILAKPLIFAFGFSL